MVRCQLRFKPRSQHIVISSEDPHHSKMFRKHSLCAVAIVLYVLIGLVSSTGFYIDNGVDQTVREKSVELHERQEIEHEILELLGLPDRPNKQHVHPSLR